MTVLAGNILNHDNVEHLNVVILLLVETLCFYVHISAGSSMISFVAMLVLQVMSFCNNFYSRVESDEWSAAQLLA